MFRLCSRFAKSGACLSAWLALTTMANAQPRAAVSAQAPVASQVEVYTRGPVHEAFVGQAQAGVSAQLIAPVAPPAPLRENPPAYAPRLNHVGWVPGYWGWDHVRKDYLWISGGWRVAPEGRRYVPGYWTQLADGYHRYPGFWVNARANQIAYLPPLPVGDHHQIGPVGVAPSRNHFWIPGSYEFREGRYTWRQGYWGRGRTDLVWTPDAYIPTPRGTIFVSGFWDLPLNARGQLFAPVAVNFNVASQANFVFTPAAALRLDTLPMHLFVGPGAAYYFGNYYGPDYVAAGWIPWYNYGLAKAAQYGYAPLFGHYQWYYGLQGVDYAARLAGWNAHFLTNVTLRPAVTLAAQTTALAGVTAANATAVALGVPLNTLVAATPGAYVHLNANQVQAFVANAAQVRVLGDQRLKAEGVAVAGISPAVSLPLPVIAPVQVPGISAATPGVSTPGVGLPGVQTPGVRLPGPNVPSVGVPGVGVPGVNVPPLGAGVGGDGGVLGGGGGLLSDGE